MQAEEGGGGQPHNHDRPPQPPPEKCPRCNSLNTKFCYYNNYSLTQPRYFCKGCRRYWTQGGTLRNVPVGGNSRKGTKRAKAVGSTSGNSSRPVIRPQPQVLLQQQKSVMMSAAGPAGLMSSEVAQYYPGGGAGYISSMPFTHSSSLNHQLGSAGNNSSSNNLNHLQGFNPISTFGQRQMQATAPTTQFYQMGGNKNTVEEPLPSLNSHLYPPAQHWANAPVSASAALGATADESALWTTPIGSNTTTTIHASPNQWPDDLARSFVDGGPP